MVSDALTLLMGFQIRLSFDMASLAYCYHIALTEVSRSLRLRRLYAPDMQNAPILKGDLPKFSHKIIYMC